ncbi:MAG: agmatine deiminase family protein [Prevotella sp.]|nr:agmatine deiminase family protein [Prevotella sp.]
MFRNDTYRMPAEWERQTAVQLTWPHDGTDWAPMLDEVLETYREMAREISCRERLIVVAPEGKAPGMLHVVCPTNDTWARDHGFITLTDDNGHCRLLDFKFNGWGEKFRADLDNAINRRLYEVGAVEGEYVDHLDFVLEGGSIESDGQGTIFTTRCCLMAPHRNQPLTQAQIEERLKQYLGAKRIVWLNHGSLIGDDTDGHIDTLVRIAPNDTLLYIGADEQHPDLLLMEQELRDLKTLDGRPYRLLRLPMPRPIVDEDGQRLPATYANFLVINDAVLVPTYSQPDLDSEALRIVGEAFPDREIIGIDCRSLIRQHGSLHCCTMQFYSPLK